MMSAQTYMKYVDECEKAYYDACNEVLDRSMDDAEKADKLKRAKDKARDKVKSNMEEEIKRSGRVVFKK